MYWNQISIFQWRMEWDMNNTFFHRSNSKHKKINIIISLQDGNKNTLTDQNNLGRWASTFFSKAYASKNRNVDVEKRNNLIQAFLSVLKEDDNEFITILVTKE